MGWGVFEVVSRDARPHPEERACRKGPANWHACTRVSKDEDGTDLGFTRDRQNSVPKSATADLGALMLRDASRRTWAVEAPALASGRDAPQHEGEGGGAFWPNEAKRGVCLFGSSERPTSGCAKSAPTPFHCLRIVIYNDFCNSHVSTALSAQDSTRATFAQTWRRRHIRTACSSISYGASPSY